MKQRLCLSLLILVMAQACNAPGGMKSVSDSSVINKNAPFYTHQVEAGSPRISKQYDSSKIEDFWPFIIYKDGSYMVAANLNSDTTLDQYGDLFEKYGGEGSGYNWAALIKVILVKENPELVQHLDLDPEASAFYLFADSEKSQRQFAEFASKVFKDKAKLIEYLTGPDKEKALNFDPKE
jgi:hypothetical protein